MKKRRLVFGMDIGGTRTKYGLVDLDVRQMVVQQILPTETRGLNSLVKTAGQAARDLIGQAELRIGDIYAGGVGIPGYVDGDQVSLVWESLEFLEGAGLRTALETELGFPLRLDNDGRTAAMGEFYFGVQLPTGGSEPAHDSSQSKRLLSLTLGTGLGIALVVDGHLLEKNSINHLAGHIPIRPGAADCFCGFSGCLESLVGGPALVRNFTRLVEDQKNFELAGLDARDIFALAVETHPVANQAVRQLLDDLVAGLNAYIYLYGPDVIVLGGGQANSFDAWLPDIEKGLFACPFDGYQVEVRLSSLGEQAGLFGAASLWE